MNNTTADTPPNLPSPTFLETLLEEERKEQVAVNGAVVEPPFNSPFPGFLDSVYEEERAIELMLRAHVSGDQARVNQLNDYILSLRSQSLSHWNSAEGN
jgi:hypothetical protein